MYTMYTFTLSNKKGGTLTTAKNVMNYELKVKETNNKVGKFHYQVIDENGTVISERKSNREYVACTINGAFYWGRINLIGKGDYKHILAYAEKRSKYTELPINWSNGNLEQIIEDAKKDIFNLTNIAYKK